MPDMEKMYWEQYDDQTEKDFTHIGYTNLSGEPVFEPITGSLEDMVREIYRCNGSSVEIRVYREGD